MAAARERVYNTCGAVLDYWPRHVQVCTILQQWGDGPNSFWVWRAHARETHTADAHTTVPSAQQLFPSMNVDTTGRSAIKCAPSARACKG